MPALPVRQIADLLPAADFTAQDIRCVACPVHINLEMEFVLVLAGEVVTCIRGAAHRLHAGEAAFILPFETHDFASQGDSRCIVLAFSQRLLPALQEFFDTRSPCSRTFCVPPALCDWIVHALPAPGAAAAPLEAAGLVAPLCALMSRRCTFAPAPAHTNDLFLDALTLIDREFAADLTLARAAAALGVTDKKLSRVFHREAGVCFSDYLALRRLSEAGDLLRAGGRTAAEIAFAVGFRSVRTFNRAFRKHYGVTPTAFAAAPAAALPFNALRGGNRA